MLRLLVLALASSLAGAAIAADAEPAFKLTLGDYHYSGGYDGQDVNLRWRRQDLDAWVGDYRDPRFGNQGRVGVDDTFALAEQVSLQPSLQAATRGFVGGSVNLQVGGTWFALVGWGRTNLRPYFNLNFDPNDAITLGAGWHGEGGRTLSLTLVADDRLHTHQKDWHLYGRWPIAAQRRLTLDLLRKSGEGDSGAVRAWGLSATLDIDRWFVRLARDPKQNFSEQDATRLAAGFRF
jgi:opacity protein-like surface antigen